MDTELKFLAAQLELISSEIDEVMARAQDKPEAIRLLAAAIGNLRPSLMKIALDVEAEQGRLAPLSIAGLR